LLKRPKSAFTTSPWAKATAREKHQGDIFMRKLTIFGAVTASVLAAGVSVAQIPAGHVQAGTLTCDISGGIGFIIGSQKALNCSFVPALPGPPEFYSGVITKLGIDLGGTRGGVMTWGVYAPTTRTVGFLAGIYAGASAEATLGAGVGANLLIGGSNHTVELQPLSIQEQTGVNIAAGVAEIELRLVR
jgi:Protein of unknown function (DUF992)